MRRLVLTILAGVTLALVAGVAPAPAIETSTYGLNVVTPSKDGRLHIDVRAGRTSTDAVRVWNKSAAPLVIRLSAVPATVAANGTASLGGQDAAAGWVHFDEEVVRLAPGERRDVRVEVKAPRRITAATRTVAVVAEPMTSGDAPAVMQRLAVTTYLKPVNGSLVAGLGLLPWLAFGVLLAVAAALVASWLRRRSPPAARATAAPAAA